MTSTEIKTIELIVNSEQVKKRLDELNTRFTTMKQRFLYLTWVQYKKNIVIRNFSRRAAIQLRQGCRERSDWNPCFSVYKKHEPHRGGTEKTNNGTSAHNEYDVLICWFLYRPYSQGLLPLSKLCRPYWAHYAIPYITGVPVASLPTPLPMVVTSLQD